ncbi:MAG: DUF952 domain-containing protein [Candidatus Binatus sp.]|uniref:DUF952 domain-containing protein n=1 Tax=Candidatus Binatus sp. TaxID=2811406 RepID=UPI003C72644B
MSEERRNPGQGAGARAGGDGPCHIVKRIEWARAVARGTYAPASLRAQGFIHCSTVAQVVDTANRFYRGHHGLVVLCIDESRLKAELKYEAAAGELFPHLYGELNVDAVARVVELPCEADGSFRLPAALPSPRPGAKGRT